MSSLRALPSAAESAFQGLLTIDQSVLDALPAAVYVCAADGVIVRHNRRAAEVWGRAPRAGDTDERFCGSHRLYLLDGRELPHAETPMAAALASGESQRDREVVIERPDGSRVTVLVNIEALKGRDGSVEGAVNCFQDITVRKRAEELLRASEHQSRQALDERRRTEERLTASESRYRAIFEGASVAIWDQDFSPLLAFLDSLRAQGVTDLRSYFSSHPEELAKAPALVNVRDVNDYAVELFEAAGKQNLLGALGATFLPETASVFLEEMVALWEGRRRFESEAIVRTLKGRRLTILLTIAWGGERCERSFVSILDISRRKATERRLKALNEIAHTLSSDLDLERIVQSVTDSATRLSGAQFGAFFYNVTDGQGERYVLYTLSGAPREAFERFGLPRNTAVFDPTFRGQGVVRSPDIRKDPRYGKNDPHFGMPKGHLPVVSYLAVPVISRSGEVLGGLFFGHEQEGVFTEETEEIVAGIAAHAALALDNGRLLQDAQNELVQRRRAEQLLARRIEEQAALYEFTARLNHPTSLDDIFEAALDTILRALHCDRASILLFDEGGVMRFVAWRGISDTYRRAVDGHSPWTPDAKDPEPITLDNVQTSDLPEDLKRTIGAEGIGACGFIPLVADGRLIGKFMTYYSDPHTFSADEIALALATARQLASGIAREKSERELRANEERLRLAAQAGKVGIWEWDIRNDRITWSDSLYPIHGVKKERFVTNFESYRALLHPEDRARMSEAIERSVKDGAPYEHEFRILKPDGQTSWVFANALVMRDAAGNATRMLGASLDITERKASEAQRDLLVAELSHRVKNTLATVVSIARQSFSKGPSIEQARESFDGRIRALARTHGRLAEGNWTGVDFETMVRDELTPYRRDDGGNMSLSGPHVTLDAKRAVVLGMAFHELATNAAKYGALSVKSGKVSVVWETTPEGDLKVRWTESKGPAVVQPARSGFGRLLLERVLASDLRGRVDMNFEAGGLRCDIVVPRDERTGRES